MRRGSHPFPVHMRRRALRSQDSPPESFGILRHPNQQHQLLRTASRHIWAGTKGRTDAACFGSTDALQNRFGGALFCRGDEALRRLPGGADARRTVCLYCPRCSCDAAGHTEQPSPIACCTTGHLRFCVEAVVRDQLVDCHNLLFVHFVNVFRTILQRDVYTHLCLSMWTLGDSTLLTVVFPADIAIYLPRKSKNLDKKWKNTVFYPNKMFFMA